MRDIGRHSHRVGLMLVMTVALFVLLAGRIVQVQVFDGSTYAAYGSAEQYEKVALPALRGTVYDRDGDVLAISVPRDDIVSDDFLASHPQKAAAELAPILHISSDRVLRLLSEHNGYVPLATQATETTVSKVEALSLPFISIVPDEERVDPTGDLFSPLLGIVGYANTGLSGIEYLYQRELAGTAGSEQVIIGPAGPLPGAKDFHPAIQGTGLVLTLDEPLQYEVTKVLGAQVLAQHADSGICVVLDTRTGGILSMVGLVREGQRVVPASQNLATNIVYQPGSVMKLATISGSLQDHVITPNESFVVPFSLWVGGWQFQDAEYHPTEELPVSQIVAQSSNIGTIEIAHELGATRLYSYLRDLGFGEKTALNWPGESAGLLPAVDTWSGSDMGTIPIGTGEAVTALQIVDAYNAVANDGEYMPPRLVEATIGPNGKEHALKGPAPHRVLDATTARELIPMFEQVTKVGTGVEAAIPGYLVAGKTGTAQIPSPTGGYTPGAWMATFVGFVPAGNPQLTAIVVMDHPSAMYGGSASAPVFSTIMQYALRHFDIAPNGNTSTSSNP